MRAISIFAFLLAASGGWNHAAASDAGRTAAPEAKPGPETFVQGRTVVPAWLRERDARAQLGALGLRGDAEAPRRGAECPVGTGKYCGDELPYCCFAPASKAYYCAQDVKHCTRD
jgi:hypothetical protein